MAARRPGATETEGSANGGLQNSCSYYIFADFADPFGEVLTYGVCKGQSADLLGVQGESGEHSNSWESANLIFMLFADFADFADLFGELLTGGVCKMELCRLCRLCRPIWGTLGR